MWGFDYRNLMYQLDCAVFQKRDDNTFKLIGDNPEWLTRGIEQDSANLKNCNPADIFPFLESFLVDAEWFWTNKPADMKRFRSAPWTEVTDDGDEYYLEASAINLDHHDVLLIERLGTPFEEKLFVIQKAREKMLELEQLMESSKHGPPNPDNASRLIKSILHDITCS